MLTKPAMITGSMGCFGRTHMERDARRVLDIADAEPFLRFHRLLQALSAQEVNQNRLGRDIGISPQTAARWSPVLRSTFQWFEHPSHSGNAVKRLSGRPKGYTVDPGIACHCLFLSSPQAIPSHPLWGALFEGFVVNEPRKQAAAMAVPPAFHHWRTHAGAEVDCVLERNGALYPIEAKSTSRPDRRDSSGIEAFRATCRRLQVGPGLVVAPCDRFHQLTEQDCAMPRDAAAG